jgi:branched-chain amino acid aminotransferase
MLWHDVPMTNSSPTHPAGSDRATPARAIAWMDGRVVPASDATVPLTDDGFLRGDSLFESVMVRGGRTHDLDAHLSRMRRSADALDMRLPVLRRVVGDLLAAWGTRDGALRLYVTRGGVIRGLIEPVAWPASISLAVVDIPWRTAISGVKTVSYAANQWAVRAARTLDGDDALVIEDGRVLELPTGAVCLVHGERISTPDPARLPILDSITLRALMRVVDVEVVVPTVDDLHTADELFVLSATRPVLGVHALVVGDGQRELPAPGPVTARAHAALDAHIDATLDPLE